LSSIEFDETGDILAVGDKGGRIVIFEREEKSDKAINSAEVLFFCPNTKL
jgi:serine/threonine-protein phosphatase 2A regulatory subunit B